MRGVMGILLVGGGTFLLIALFNGTLKFPLGQINPSGLNPSTPPSLQQGVNPQPPKTPGGSPTCPTGMKYDPTTGKCVNIYQGNR